MDRDDGVILAVEEIEEEHIEETYKVGLSKGSNSFCLADELPHDIRVRLVMCVENLDKDVVMRVGILG